MQVTAIQPKIDTSHLAPETLMGDKRLTELKQKIELMAGQSPVLIQQNQQPTPL